MPSDLNLKKSWHPGLLKNQKKVWEEEQDRLKEHQKVQKRQQELAEERTKLELLKLQYGDDLLKLPATERLKLNKLDWMYDDPTVKSSQGVVNEDGFHEVEGDFDVGKKEVEQLLLGKKKFDVERNSRLNKILGTDVTRTTTAATTSKNLYSDDPLAMIKQGMKREAKKSHDKRSRIDKHHPTSRKRHEQQRPKYTDKERREPYPDHVHLHSHRPKQNHNDPKKKWVSEQY
ncbi:RNA-splicing factor [Scheffersomyces spartinae]|uniref:Pre-mRNA-splicing factor CWC25 n=1 Tax=Scheffersomyces spartinae TaxID=45513 RepID=A0A9P7VBP8_9ASCO|nr:RNA-splicing factor [Scheffersomyces spartinae]KAG7194853.1 RNA-splicing factor [Scheffersomyces spartinae]